MKIFQILTLINTVAATRPHSLVSTTRTTVSKANIGGVLAVTAKKSQEFALETLPRLTVQGAAWVAANPGTTAAYGTAGVGLLFITAPGLAAAPALGAIGFGADGIVAGSYAATIHSSIGSVISPSLFATLQSAGAGGYGVTTVYPIIQTIGGAIASSSGASVAWVKSMSGSKAQP